MPWTYGWLVRRALAVGALVGLALAAYLVVVLEPTIDTAIGLEHTEAGDGHDELFTRGQQVAGGMLAEVLVAVAVAGVFGTVYAAVRHRIPAGSELARTTWLAAVGFVAVALIPAIKYPASPPGSGDPSTVGERTVLYVACLVAASVVAVLLIQLSAALRRRGLGDHTRVLMTSAAAVTAYGVLLAVLPGSPDVDGGSLPAGLVWDFRVRSLGGLALLWSGLGVGLGWWLDRERQLPRPAGR